MNKSKIRAGTIDDVSQLRLLSEQLGYPQTEDTMRERLQLYLNTPNYNVFVAERDSKVIGYVALSYSELFVLPWGRLHIEAIIVDKDYKGQGVGRALMLAAENFAKDIGCNVIDLTSGLRRRIDGTHEFYKALGYSNEGIMEKLYLRKEL